MKYLFIFLLCLGSVDSVLAATQSIAHLEQEALIKAGAFSKDIEALTKVINKRETSGDINEFSSALSNAPIAEPLNVHLKKVSSVLVFLSFSMPEKSLEGWLLQCRQSGATPVIRGLIHNSFQETLQVVQRLSEKTGLGVQIDPILFSTFGIAHVPAVVHVKETPNCPAGMNCKPVDYDRLFGDVSLDYALDTLKGGSENPMLDDMLSRLRGGRL